MNRDQKAAVIERVAAEIEQAEAVLAVDYRGISVKQAAELRGSLAEAGASLRIVKNTLTERAAEQAGAESLKELLDGPTALTFVRGDVALAAKALSTFRRQAGLIEFKGGQLGDTVLSVEQIENIARLPARDVLHGQFVGVLASPLTTLVRGLASMISGLAVALGQIQEQGLIGQGAAEPAAEAPAEPAAAPQAEPAGEAASEPAAAPQAEPAGEAASEPAAAPQGEPAGEAASEPQADAEAATDSTETDTAPSEGEETQEG